jgi:hypothetical protein
MQSYVKSSILPAYRAFFDVAGRVPNFHYPLWSSGRVRGRIGECVKSGLIPDRIKQNGTEKEPGVLYGFRQNGEMPREN